MMLLHCFLSARNDRGRSTTTPCIFSSIPSSVALPSQNGHYSVVLDYQRSTILYFWTSIADQHNTVLGSSIRIYWTSIQYSGNQYSVMMDQRTVCWSPV